MILKQTILTVTDKSGLNCIKVFQLYGGFWRKCTKIGFYIKGSARKIKPKNFKNKTIVHKKLFKKGHIIRAFLTKQSYNLHRNDGRVLKLKDNTCITIKKKKIPLSKYILGIGLIDIRKKKFLSLFNYKL